MPANQMMLFKDLPTPAAVVMARRARAGERPAPQAATQLAFTFYLRALERDDLADEFEQPPLHSWVSATEAPRVEVQGPASVFQLGAFPVRVRLAPEQPAGPPIAVTRVVRDAGLVRVERIAVQETAEWQERERARRARQKPPRPTKKARTRGKKLLEIIGVVDHGED